MFSSTSILVYSLSIYFIGAFNIFGRIYFVTGTLKVYKWAAKFLNVGIYFGFISINLLFIEIYLRLWQNIL